MSMMNMALGLMLARDLADNRQKVMAALLAAQLPANNLVGAALLKPTFIDTVADLEKNTASLAAERQRSENLKNNLDTVNESVKSIATLLGLQPTAEATSAAILHDVNIRLKSIKSSIASNNSDAIIESVHAMFSSSQPQTTAQAQATQDSAIICNDNKFTSS